MKTHPIKTLTLISSLLILTACSQGSLSLPDKATEDTSDSAQAITPTQGIDITAATSQQCPAGGQVFTIYSDQNKNGLRDSAETVSNEQILCNGQNGSAGSNGLSTLFSVTRVGSDFVGCASQAGVQINSGLDVNFSGSLEASEISQAQILCDGEKGATGNTGATGSTGATGASGANGHSLVFKMIPASSESCSAGGTTLLVALDIHNNGVYDVNAKDQQSMTICNGTSAATSAYSPVETIIPCGQDEKYPFKEVLLRLANGEVLASFSDNANGKMTRLTFLPDGSYMTTDNSQCHFTLATSDKGHTRSISWFDKIQMSWEL